MNTESVTPAETTTTAASESKVDESQSTTQATSSETKPAEATKTPTEPAKVESKDVVPEKYDLKIPEGSPLSAKKVEELSLYAKEKGLTNEQAQEVLNRESNAVTEHMKSIQDNYAQQIETWRQDSMKDQELGGDKFGENVELAKRAVDQFASPEFKKLLDETGFGNHKEVLRVFSKIGREMAEGKIHSVGSQGSDTTTREERLYPSMYSKK